MFPAISIYLHRGFTFPDITVIDILEILILSVLLYCLLSWFKKTRAWNLLKGILIILLCVLLAELFHFTTLSWLAGKLVGIGIIAVVIIFQPELRHALEHIGRKSLFSRFFSFRNNAAEYFTDDTRKELLKAVRRCSREKTGLLICVEMDIDLSEYENTGIRLDAEVSEQLLVNIFQDKTPLHDGAVILRDDRIASATSYLPLSDSYLDKNYGTRHRAAKGMSEVTDAFTIVVSEETGDISYTYQSQFVPNVSLESLKARLMDIQTKQTKKQKKKGENHGKTSA